MPTPIHFDCEELQVLRSRAESFAAIGGTSPTWIRAYERLADAADHLEAMMRRCMVTKTEQPVEEE